MFRTLFLLNEMRPSVRMKRYGQALGARLEGQKMQRKYKRLYHQIPKPEYKIEISKNNENTTNP